MKISKRTLIFIGILSIAMSLSLIIAGFYVHLSGNQDITLEATDRTSGSDIASQEEASTPDGSTESNEATEIIECTTKPNEASESLPETTISETTAKESTIEVTTVEDTTAEETTVEETTVEETTAEETTVEETTAEETTVEETTAVPETTVHVHSYSPWEIITEPTCEKAGKQERKCDCGNAQTMPIEALGHTIKKIPAVSATCQKTGLSAGESCSVCQKTLKKQAVTAKIKCKYEKSFCVYCL